MFFETVGKWNPAKRPPVGHREGTLQSVRTCRTPAGAQAEGGMTQSRCPSAGAPSEMRWPLPAVECGEVHMHQQTQ